MMDRKKGYYIHFGGRQSIGVSKKIDMQIAEFSKYFNMCEIDIAAVPRSLFKRVLGLFPTMSIEREYGKAITKIEQPHFIYVRRTVADHDYLSFFKQIKACYPDCKIIIEIFTFPYDKDDFGKWNAWPFYLKECIYRRWLKNYIDRFVTYSKDDMIFGIPTIRTTNGVSSSKVEKITGDGRADQITLIGVAYMQRQHGFERLIEGMRDYYSNYKDGVKVYLYLVGDGPEKVRYENLIDKYELQKYVSCYPTTIGVALDELYNKADISLAAFGFYKAGVYENNSSLKANESLVKGLPVATGCSIAGIEKDCSFVFLFPNDSSVVDIEQIVYSYQRLKKQYGSKEKLSEVIRNFGVEKFDITVTMQPIIDYVRGNL